MSSATLNSPPARDFVEAVQPMLPAYRVGVFSFVAVTHEGEKAILRARLQLYSEEVGALKRPLSTGTVWAGQVRLNVDAGALDACLRSVASGSWLPIVGEHLFKLLPRTPLQYSDGYSFYYKPPQQLSAPSGHQMQSLTISGIGRYQIVNAHIREIERELNDSGIDSLDELLRGYDLRGSDDTTLEITTGPVAMFGAESRLTGRQAHLQFRLADGLPVERLRINLRDADSRVVGPIATLRGGLVGWTRQNGFQEGQWTFDLPGSALIDCGLLYDGRAQDGVRLADIRALPNPRRMLTDLVDPGLERLGKLLINPERTQAEDFEAGLGWLFQLLGFAPIHVSAMSGLKDEPDLLVMGPQGEVLIVECTIGVPDDAKLTRLVSRVARMRERLIRAEGACTASKVTGMLISSRPSEELVTIQSLAHEHAVLLLCQLDLEAALARTLFAPDPDGILKNWRDRAMIELLTGGR